MPEICISNTAVSKSTGIESPIKKYMYHVSGPLHDLHPAPQWHPSHQMILRHHVFWDCAWCIGESGAQSAILWNLLVVFLLFAKFGLKTNALLVENMVMEMFYTGFHIHSKQFSLYLLVMWSSKTYILIILYNNVFSSDSELKIHICVSVQILNWNHYFQFRFLTENLFLSFSSDSELKLLCFQFRFLTEFFFWSLSSDSDLKDSIYIIDLCQDRCTLHTSINCCKERKTKTIILIVFISNIVHFFFFWEHFIVCLWSVRPGDHEWQNAKTAGLKWEGKKGQRLQT